MRRALRVSRLPPQVRRHSAGRTGSRGGCAQVSRRDRTRAHPHRTVFIGIHPNRVHDTRSDDAEMWRWSDSGPSDSSGSVLRWPSSSVDPVDPVGTFDMIVSRPDDADTLLVRLTIEGTPDVGFSGSVEADMVSAKVTSIAVDGSALIFVIPSAGADVRLDFKGDDFTGSMSLARGDVHVRGVGVGITEVEA